MSRVVVMPHTWELAPAASVLSAPEGVDYVLTVPEDELENAPAFLAQLIETTPGIYFAVSKPIPLTTRASRAFWKVVIRIANAMLKAAGARG